jgi:hypothetical protein
MSWTARTFDSTDSPPGSVGPLLLRSHCCSQSRWPWASSRHNSGVRRSNSVTSLSGRHGLHLPGLAAEADALADRDPILAARLAVTAYRQDGGPQAIAAMMRGDLAGPTITALRANESIAGLAVAAAARQAVTLSQDSLLEIVDLSSGQSTARRQLPGSTGKWSTVAISSDGRTVMAGDDQGQLVMLDEGLTQTVPLSRLPGTVVSIDVSRDGSLATAVDNGGNVLLLSPPVDGRFDVLPGTAGRIDQEGRPVAQALTSTPDGRWLLIHRPGKVELWNLVEGARPLTLTPMLRSASWRWNHQWQSSAKMGPDLQCARAARSQPGMSAHCARLVLRWPTKIRCRLQERSPLCWAVASIWYAMLAETLMRSLQ